jgi:hypothetical protein
LEVPLFKRLLCPLCGGEMMGLAGKGQQQKWEECHA